MQVFLIILCRKIIFWLLSSPFPTLFLSFSYLQYNNKPKSQENTSILSKNLLKMLTKGGKKLVGKKLATNYSPLISPLFPTLSFFAIYLIFPCFKSLIQELVLYSYTNSSIMPYHSLVVFQLSNLSFFHLSSSQILC